MTVYLKLKVPESVNILKYVAKKQDKCISDESIPEIASELIIEKELVSNFSTSLHDLLLKGTSGNAFELTNSVKDENGLEAWRKIARGYEPRTPGTKRALLMQILNNQCAKKVGDVETNLINIERLINRYESMTDEANRLPDEVKATIIIALCHRELRDYLELSTGDMMYDKFRAEIMNHVELKRDTTEKNIKQMEIDAVRCDYEGDQENWYYEEDWWQNPEPEPTRTHMEMNFFGKGKGKGKSQNWTKGSGKGKGFWGQEKGSWGQDKGGYKGSYKGSGKGKGFQGDCHFCGEWGHSQRNCPKKDKQMQEYRAAHGIPEPTYNAGKGGLHAVGAENTTNPGRPVDPTQSAKDIAALETQGSYRYLSQLSTQKPNKIEVRNRYGALEVDHVTIDNPPGLILSDFIKPRMKQNEKKERQKLWKKKLAEDEELIERAIELNCVQKRIPSQGMYHQSDEELYAEKAQRQKEFKEMMEKKWQTMEIANAVIMMNGLMIKILVNHVKVLRQSSTDMLPVHSFLWAHKTCPFRSKKVGFLGVRKAANSQPSQGMKSSSPLTRVQKKPCATKKTVNNFPFYMAEMKAIQYM
jgi:hypothetical protein